MIIVISCILNSLYRNCDYGRKAGESFCYFCFIQVFTTPVRGSTFNRLWHVGWHRAKSLMSTKVTSWIPAGLMFYPQSARYLNSLSSLRTQTCYLFLIHIPQTNIFIILLSFSLVWRTTVRITLCHTKTSGLLYIKN